MVCAMPLWWTPRTNAQMHHPPPLCQRHMPMTNHIEISLPLMGNDGIVHDSEGTEHCMT
jgi:hypothetical protein